MGTSDYDADSGLVLREPGSFERQTTASMMIPGARIIPLLVLPLVFELTPTIESTFFALDWFIWAAFVVEYGVRLYLAPSKRYFVGHNIIDLLFVLIPFLRPLRIVRSVRAFSVLRAARGTVILLRAIKAVQDVLKRHNLGYTLLIAAVVVVGSGLLIAELEKSDPERNIRSIPDALWWAITTITTVGYGDRFPVTAIGRAVGAVVMVIGIGLFGLLAASLASFMVEKDIERNSIPRWLKSMSGSLASRRCLAISSQPLPGRIWRGPLRLLGHNCHQKSSERVLLPGSTWYGHQGRPAPSVTIHISSTSRRLGPPGFDVGSILTMHPSSSSVSSHRRSQRLWYSTTAASQAGHSMPIHSLASN